MKLSPDIFMHKEKVISDFILMLCNQDNFFPINIFIILNVKEIMNCQSNLALGQLSYDKNVILKVFTNPYPSKSETTQH